MSTELNRSGSRATSQATRGRSLWAWTGSWTGSPDNPSAENAISAMTLAIGAASACAARARASRNAPLAGFRPAVALRWDHVLARRDAASRRWITSHTTRVSAVSGSLSSSRWPRRTSDVRYALALYVSSVSACPAASCAQFRAQSGSWPADRFKLDQHLRWVCCERRRTAVTANLKV
jgi:hypothetical protein